MKRTVPCCFVDTSLLTGWNLGLTTMALTGFCNTLATAVQDGKAELLGRKYQHFLLDTDG